MANYNSGRSGLGNRGAFGNFQAELEKMINNLDKLEEATLKGIIRDSEDWLGEMFEAIFNETPISLDNKEERDKINEAKKKFRTKLSSAKRPDRPDYNGGDLRRSLKAKINGKVFKEVKKNVTPAKRTLTVQRLKAEKRIDMEVSVGTPYGMYQMRGKVLVGPTGAKAVTSKDLKYAYFMAKKDFIMRNIRRYGPYLMMKYKLRMR